VTEDALIRWLQSVDRRLGDVVTELAKKADKEDVNALASAVVSLQGHARDDEVEKRVVGRWRSGRRDLVKWALGIAAMIGAGAIGSAFH